MRQLWSMYGMFRLTFLHYYNYYIKNLHVYLQWICCMLKLPKISIPKRIWELILNLFRRFYPEKLYIVWLNNVITHSCVTSMIHQSLIHICSTSVVWYTFRYSYMAFKSGFSRWGMLMNYFVHSFMYTYYTLRAMKIHVPKPVAMMITTMQIAQVIPEVDANMHRVELAANKGGQFL